MVALYTYDKLPTTSGEAIREFSDRYIAASAVAAPPTIATELGEVIGVNSPMVTYPLSEMSGIYQETVGDSRFSTATEDSFDIKVKEFDMGFEAPLLELFIQSFRYKKWQQAAATMADAEVKHIAKSLVTLLEAGETTACFDGKYFFATDHPADKHDSTKGSWGNLQGSGKDPNSIGNILAECTAMEGAVLDVNGDKVGTTPTHIYLPTAKFRLVDALLKMQQVSAASGTGVPSSGTGVMSNPIAGLTAVHAPGLTDANDWYLVDMNLAKRLPIWAALKMNVPASLALRSFDESSDFFRNTGKIKVSSHIWYGFGLVWPHAIRKVTGA